MSNLNLSKIGYAGGVLFVLLLAAVIILGPLIVIWALNTLFPVLSIEYTFWTWLSVIIVGAYVRGDVKIKTKR